MPMALCAILGLAMDTIAYKPLRNKPRLAALITAIGVSFFLGNLVSYIGPESVRTLAIIIFVTAGLTDSSIRSHRPIQVGQGETQVKINFLMRGVGFASLLLIGLILWSSKSVLAQLKWKGASFTAFSRGRYD
jgi:branched-subunit amino acid ABC-type transport system permease component